MSFITPASFMEPHCFSAPAPWAGHIPFASWLMSVQQPETLVELGAYSGISYLAFCQAIQQQGLSTRAFAVDTWQGDAHAGIYDESIYQTLKRAHDPHYTAFSTLLRMTFDEALPLFADASVDLLHIDGLHTYEAVRHDFDGWLSKLSARGVVLFHDTHVYRDDFGVHRLWAEVSSRYPSLHFTHSNGLGMVLVGLKQPPALLALCGLADGPGPSQARQVFAALGARLERRADVLILENKLDDARVREAQLELAGEQRHQWIEKLDQQLLELQRRESHAHAEVIQIKRVLEVRDNTIAVLNQQLLELQQHKAHSLNQVEQLQRKLDFQVAGASRQLAQQLLELQRRESHAHAEVIQLKNVLEVRDNTIAVLNQQLLELQQHKAHSLNQVEQLQQKLDFQVAGAARQLAETELVVRKIYLSRSWRVTKSLRFAGDMARRMRASVMGRSLQRARNAARYVWRGEWSALAARAKSMRREATLSQRLNIAPGTRHIGIMATPHTLFVAHLLADALHKADFTVEILTQAPEDGFTRDVYIVVCPQMFKCLPPGEKRIAFQMEQSVSSRWFTHEYLSMLENSLAVLDYAQTNLQFLEQHGIAYPHTYLVPIGGFVGYSDYLRTHQLQPPSQDAPCDVLFYGDVHAPRRQAMLAALRQRFNVRVEGDLFGPALHQALASARVVVNIHYYEGALLETTRIYECLSLGIPLVSEASADMEEHANLAQSVHFVPVGDTQALLQAVGAVLAAKQSLCSADVRVAAVLESGQHFQFMLYRALYALRFIGHTEWEKLTQSMPLPGKLLALSLPETTRRRTAFQQIRPPGVRVFDGIRQRPGWVGCALSYKHLAHKAVQAGVAQLEVMEDDVLFPPDYAARRCVVDSWLAQHAGQWDVFAGLIAQVHVDTRVLAVEQYGGLTFVTLDRMTSMVFNIYAPPVLRLLAQWDCTNTDAETNTIDRFLQSRSSLRVVIVLPFLVGHSEELDSSLWGFNNAQYNALIEESAHQLQQAVQRFLAFDSPPKALNFLNS